MRFVETEWTIIDYVCDLFEDTKMYISNDLRFLGIISFVQIILWDL